MDQKARKKTSYAKERLRGILALQRSRDAEDEEGYTTQAVVEEYGISHGSASLIEEIWYFRASMARRVRELEDLAKVLAIVDESGLSPERRNTLREEKEKLIDALEKTDSELAFMVSTAGIHHALLPKCMADADFARLLQVLEDSATENEGRTPFDPDEIGVIPARGDEDQWFR